MVRFCLFRFHVYTIVQNNHVECSGFNSTIHVHQCVSRKGIDHTIEAAIYGLELQERFVKVIPELA